MVLSSGTYAVGTGPNGALPWIDCATGQTEEDDLLGAIATFTTDPDTRLVVKSTSTRVSFPAPLWAPPEPRSAGSA